MPEQNKSVGWVVGMVALAVGYFGWAFLAADYHQNGPGAESRGETNFWVNSLDQLSNLPGVLSHGVQNRLWLLVLVVAAELSVLVLWGVLKKLERELLEQVGE